MSKTITIIEHQVVYESRQSPPADNELTHEQFVLLDNFITDNSVKNGINVMTYTKDKYSGRTGYKARHYVGTITLKDGTNIEILPKIYKGNDGEKGEAKGIFLDMLRALYGGNNKNFHYASLETSKLPLFEIFIRMFTDEVFSIVRRGLKGGYVTVSSNENALKGKLLFSRHIRENYVNKQRFFVEYDEFNNNQPENRLLKSTLLYLDKRAVNAKNRQYIKTLLAYFDEVPASIGYDADFKLARAAKGRNSAHYQTALNWSRVFLQGKTFTAFAGKEYARALLFDMNKLFESYIAKRIGVKLSELNKNYTLYTQDSRFYLFNKPEKSFSLRPDIVIKEKVSGGGRAYILDTKWKEVFVKGEDKPNGGISVGDMYQMFAYFKVYGDNGENPQSVTLIFPKTSQTDCSQKICFLNDVGNVVVKVFFVDLRRGYTDGSIGDLLKEVVV